MHATDGLGLSAAEIILRKEGIAAAKNVYLWPHSIENTGSLVAGNKGMHVFSKAAYERIIAYKKNCSCEQRPCDKNIATV